VYQLAKRLTDLQVATPTGKPRWNAASVRGILRDIEAALAEVLGPEAALSRSTVSRICQRIKDEFQAWRTRDLSGVCLPAYLFLDGSVRHEAPSDRAGWKDPPAVCRSRPLKLRAA
jgi:hypothetical protein